MRKRAQIALAVLAVALVGVAAWRATQPPDEPVYKGMTLSEWLKYYDMGYIEHEKEPMPAPSDAVPRMGTNAIPALLRMLRRKDSTLTVNLTALVERQRIFKVHYTKARKWNLYGGIGFYLLGTNAQSAVPKLIEIANENISPESQSYAINALVYIGPAAKEAVPSLLRWATNANVDVRSTAIGVLGRIDPEAAAKADITVLRWYPMIP